MTYFLRSAFFALFLLLPVRAFAEPQMFVVSDEDTTVHILGTIHFMPADVDWRTDEIDSALASADAVYFEADVFGPEVQASMQQYIFEHGINPPGVYLSSLMSQDEYRKLEAFAASVGLSAAGLEPMRPWLAAINLSVFQLVSEGYDPESGIDQVLHRVALANGNELRFFETVEEQLGIFSGMAPETELDMLLSTIEEAEMVSGLMDQMLTLWMAGDYEGMDALTGPQTRDEYPEVYDMIYTSRNANWTDQIVELMDEPGTFFIAVGSGHLGGPEGVPTMLRDRGLAVE